MTLTAVLPASQATTRCTVATSTAANTAFTATPAAAVAAAAAAAEEPAGGGVLMLLMPRILAGLPACCTDGE